MKNKPKDKHLLVTGGLSLALVGAGVLGYTQVQKVEKLEERIHEAETLYAQQAEDNKALQGEIHTYSLRVDELSEELATATTDLTNTKGQLEMAKKSLTTVTNEKDGLQSRVTALNAKVKELTEKDAKK